MGLPADPGYGDCLPLVFALHFRRAGISQKVGWGEQEGVCS